MLSLFFMIFVRIRRLRKSPQYLLVFNKEKWQSPQICAIIRKTVRRNAQNSVKILARKIPISMATDEPVTSHALQHFASPLHSLFETRKSSTDVAMMSHGITDYARYDVLRHGNAVG